MSSVNILLDKYRQTCGLPSDSTTADALGIKRQAIHQWRKGLSWPSDEHTIAMAKKVDEAPEKWLLAIHADRASKAAKPYWLKALAAAACMILTISFSRIDVQTTAVSALTAISRNPGSVYIMSTFALCIMALGTVLALRASRSKEEAHHEIQMVI